ncbi:MAG: hypothetical protein R3321_09400 [Nitrososphaeraceae archaeon]|nr:hypothetical protein [Nitrososphaeraceae archaeon]
MIDQNSSVRVNRKRMLKRALYEIWKRDDTGDLGKVISHMADVLGVRHAKIREYLREFEIEGMIEIDHDLGWVWLRDSYATSIEKNLKLG